MNNLTFEQIQQNLKTWMGDTVKPGTQKGNLIEHTYIRGLIDGGVIVPTVVLMLAQSGRSIVTFKSEQR